MTTQNVMRRFVVGKKSVIQPQTPKQSTLSTLRMLNVLYSVILVNKHRAPLPLNSWHVKALYAIGL